MIDLVRIGKLIQERRVKLDLTQEDVGKKVGVTGQAVSKWEQGISLPDTALLPGICRVLSIAPSTLLGVEESSEMNEKESRKSLFSNQQMWFGTLIMFIGLAGLFVSQVLSTGWLTVLASLLVIGVGIDGVVSDR